MARLSALHDSDAGRVRSASLRLVHADGRRVCARQYNSIVVDTSDTLVTLFGPPGLESRVR